MLNLPIHPKHSIAPFTITIICLVLAFAEPASSDFLAYNREKIADFQIWRLITGHILHTNIVHLLLNLAGLLLLWALHGQYYKNKSYLVIWFILCIGTSIGIYVFSPSLRWYVGLSGVLHGLFVIGAYFDLRQGLKTGWLLIIGVWIKVIHEQLYGASDNIAHLINANVAIDAHLYGTLTGCFIILYLIFKPKRETK